MLSGAQRDDSASARGPGRLPAILSGTSRHRTVDAALAASNETPTRCSTALTRARYLEASGRWPALALTPAYERFPEVWSLDSYEQLLDAETEERIAAGLQNLVLELFVGSATARHDERLVAAERHAGVEWGGEAMPWRYARQLVGLEEERGPRHDLDEAIRAASQALPRLRLDRLTAARRQIEEVGRVRPADRRPRVLGARARRRRRGHLEAGRVDPGRDRGAVPRRAARSARPLPPGRGRHLGGRPRMAVPGPGVRPDLPGRTG